MPSEKIWVRSVLANYCVILRYVKTMSLLNYVSNVFVKWCRAQIHFKLLLLYTVTFKDMHENAIERK